MVPAKLVAKIQKGDYVDMAELLKDNIEVGRRKDTQEGAAGGVLPFPHGGDLKGLDRLLRRHTSQACTCGSTINSDV